MLLMLMLYMKWLKAFLKASPESKKKELNCTNVGVSNTQDEK